MPATELSVAQLRQEAKKSIGQVLTPKVTASSALLLAERTFQDALRSDEQQKLSDAFYKYQQGARYSCFRTVNELILNSAPLQFPILRYQSSRSKASPKIVRNSQEGGVTPNGGFS